MLSFFNLTLTGRCKNKWNVYGGTVGREETEKEKSVNTEGNEGPGEQTGAALTRDM